MTNQSEIVDVFMNQNPISATLKIITFSTIIFCALFGNILVMLAVTKFRRLRKIRTNMFLISLAFADFLVALIVMPFNAVQSLLSGIWPFPQAMCNLFLANDVLFSTASILHLCCISVDRYVAVFKPLKYECIMTRKRICFMLVGLWSASFLISYIPIWSDIYTTDEGIRNRGPLRCDFIVNPLYAIISSLVSFWIPCFVMTITYARIYHQAKSQSSKIKQIQPKLSTNIDVHRNSEMQYLEVPQPNAKSPLTRNESNVEMFKQRKRRPYHGKRNNHALFPELKKQNLILHQSKQISNENKAAKTLGIIMSAFIICLLPFFSWYTITNICKWFGDCPPYPMLTEVLFWIGYFNSTLNPMIYVLFNQEFRFAFCKLLGCRFGSRNVQNMRLNSGGVKSSVLLIDEKEVQTNSQRLTDEQ